MRVLYTIALYAMMPYVWLRLAWRARRDRGYLRHVGERLGFGPAAGAGGILVHAVSVGEVQAALPLLDLMLEQYRGPVLLTTSTPSGRRRGEALFSGRVVQRYLPWDLPGATRRFLARTAPRAVIVLETELWPNLIHACAERSIPLVYVNARLSERSAAGYRRFRRLFAPPRPRGGGRPPRPPASSWFRGTGSGPGGSRLSSAASASPYRFAPRDSTSAPMCSSATRWGSCRSSTPLRTSLSSAGVSSTSAGANPPGRPADVGGHTLLEPAGLGIPALSGPYTRNFADLATSLRAVGAVRVVHGTTDLAAAVVDLLRDPNRRHRMGEEGREFVLANRGARDRTMAVIDRQLGAAA